MPVHDQPSGGHNDIVLVQSLPHHHRKLPCTADIKEEEEEVVAFEVEPPVPMPKPSLSQAVVEVEQRPVLDAAAPACKEDVDSHLEVEEELPEYMYIDLKEIRKEMQCPICLGIIRKTRTVMECLHRFCRECIDKSMRMGNNECPACRTHCASRRSLRDDPRHDALIAALFPDIEKYEEEELALCEEDKTRNKQIQESIAQIFKRQSEALGKKRSSCKGLGVPTPSRPQRNNRGTPSRRRKRTGRTELEELDYDEDLDITEGQTLSRSDGHYKEIDQHRPKTRRRVGSYTSLSPATSSDGGCVNNKIEKKMTYPGIMWNIEMRAWGKGGTRSNTRHGSASGRIRKNSQDARLAKFIEFLQNIEKRDDEYVASETPSGVDKPPLEVNESPLDFHHKQEGLPISPNTDNKSKLSEAVDHRDGLQLPEEKKTVAGFEAHCISQGGQLILACRQKEAL